MLKKYLILSFLLLLSISLNAQQENVPLDNDVYTFLKEMKLKGVVDDIHEDNPNMSRAEVKKHLEEVNLKSADLSLTESKLLKKFQNEFYDELADSTNSFQFFGKSPEYSKDYSDFFSNKLKDIVFQVVD